MNKITLILNLLILFSNTVFSVSTNQLTRIDYTSEKITVSEDSSAVNESIDTTFFFIMYNQIDFIDSKKGVLRRAHSKGPIIANLQLTENETSSIKRVFLDNKLNQLPNKFIPKNATYGIPIERTIIVYYKGKYKWYFYDTSYEGSITDKEEMKMVEGIKLFIDFIDNIIYKKDNIKNLLRSDIDLL